MSDLSTLEALQALHRELVAVSEHRYDGLEALDAGLQDHALMFKKLIDKRPRKAESRKAVELGEHKTTSFHWTAVGLRRSQVRSGAAEGGCLNYRQRGRARAYANGHDGSNRENHNWRRGVQHQ